MAAPQGGYPQADGYGQNPAVPQEQSQYDAGPPPDAAAGPAAAAGRKKRAYAGQAYDFGAGANSALGGQQQGGGAYQGGFNQQAHEAGYPQGGYQQSIAAPAQTPGIGQQPVAGVGGYQPAAPAYPVQPGGINSMTQQFGQMDMSQKQAPPAPTSRPQLLNQLYPTDLLKSPFDVAELDYPPPAPILPQNVSELTPACGLVLTGPDKRNTLSQCQLSSEIRSVNPKCCSHHPLPTQKVSFTFRPRHPTVHVTARY